MEHAWLISLHRKSLSSADARIVSREQHLSHKYSSARHLHNSSRSCGYLSTARAAAATAAVLHKKGLA